MASLFIQKRLSSDLTYIARPVQTSYWKPGDDWLADTVRHVAETVREGDFLVVSEKAISVATGRIIDEDTIKPTFLARLVAVGWMRVVWGRILGRICHLNSTNISRLREYPIEKGAIHKQAAMNHAGFFQALRHGSEGGIDASNLPFSLVALPLEDAEKEATKIRERLFSETTKRINTLIVDSDKTYSLRWFHMSVRPTSIKAIRCLGLSAYILGRLLKLTPRSTPLALVGENLSAEEALQISAVANKVRGSGAGRTAWDMGETFHVKPHEVTWEMLQTVRHTPIVIVRKVSGGQAGIPSSGPDSLWSQSFQKRGCENRRDQVCCCPWVKFMVWSSKISI
jgi:F420-0:gamma-glutamyl ligase-like protein